MAQSIGAILILFGVWLFLCNHKHEAVPPLLFAGILFVGIGQAMAHDMDHPEEDEWYRTLMQPDNPTASCCGVADAYWCDGTRTHDGKNFCVITDDRVVPGRTPVPVGTEIQIPDYKYKWDKFNPTGHAIVFLSSAGYLYCYVQNGGV